MSTYLFANPTYVDGIMSVIDLFGISNEYNTSSNEAKADERALRADVQALKEDAKVAFNQVVANA